MANLASGTFYCRNLSGFTLIELMTSLAMLAVLLSIAAPSYRTALTEARIKSEVQRLHAAVLLARSSAVARGVSVQLCPGSQASAACAGRYSDGFYVQVTGGELLRVFTPAARLTVRNRAGDEHEHTALAWNAEGIANRNLTLSICANGELANWSLILNRVGRPKVRRDWGDCSAVLAP